MSIEKIRPMETPSDDGETRLDHPAFALISANRVVGGSTSLAGSPVMVSSLVELTVTRAHAYQRDVGTEHWHDDKVMLTLQLSETQWAALISSMNRGNGIPATVSYGPPVEAKLERYPGIERVTDAERRSADINSNMKNELAKALAATRRIREISESKGPVSKNDLKEAIRNLEVALGNAPANFQFAADQITRHMERLVHVAKEEINAHAMAFGIAGAVSAPGMIEDQSGSLGVVAGKP